MRSEQLRIGILPLGLIGGSLAKAFARAKQRYAGELEIIGLATREAVLEAALNDGAIDRGGLMPRIPTDPDWQQKLLATGLLQDCDVIFLCTPVEIIAPLGTFLAQHTKALLTDVGSIKAAIVEDMRGLPFIGGHPMAGSERTGYYCASESLFDHAAYVLCPSETEGLELLLELVELLGARSLVLDAAEHDHLVARISHLPHVVAAGLVNTALSHDDKLALSLSAGGFRDITRIASSDPELWAGICLESGRELASALDEMIRDLEDFRTALDGRDEAALVNFFGQANEKRALVPQQGVGPLISDAQILINIDDRPGVLAELTRLLSEAEINIHNLSIQDARQYEGGQVRLFITGQADAVRAEALLKEAGYDVED